MTRSFWCCAGSASKSRRGAIVALLGANGAGKSTTLKAISGLLKTEDGEVIRGEIVFDGSASTASIPTRSSAAASFR